MSKTRSYAEDSLKSAIQAIKDGEMSINKAASVYSIPRTTLQYKIKENFKMESSHCELSENKSSFETIYIKEEVEDYADSDEDEGIFGIAYASDYKNSDYRALDFVSIQMDSSYGDENVKSPDNYEAVGIKEELQGSDMNDSGACISQKGGPEEVHIKEEYGQGSDASEDSEQENTEDIDQSTSILEQAGQKDIHVKKESDSQDVFIKEENLNFEEYERNFDNAEDKNLSVTDSGSFSNFMERSYKVKTTFHQGESSQQEFKFGVYDNWERNQPALMENEGKPGVCSTQPDFSIFPNHEIFGSTEKKKVGPKLKSDLIRPHKCPYCDYSASQKCNLNMHIKTHTGERPFKCPYCTYDAVRKIDMKHHIRGHTGEKPFKCPMCDHTTSRKSHLIVHIRNHTGEKPFKCSVCDFSTTQRTHLLIHERSHTGEKPFQCIFCDYRSSQKSHLNVHLKSHTGERPYKCTFCPYTFIRNSDLKRHLRTHTGEKPYKCTMCDYTAGQKSHINDHMNIHTGGKPFKCSQCDYCCARRADLRVHNRKHLRPKIFNCEFCEFTTARKTLLPIHVENHHPEKVPVTL